MKVLIATAEFGEDIEVYYAVHRLIEEGIEPVVAAPVKKRQTLPQKFTNPSTKTRSKWPQTTWQVCSTRRTSQV